MVSVEKDIKESFHLIDVSLRYTVRNKWKNVLCLSVNWYVVVSTNV